MAPAPLGRAALLLATLLVGGLLALFGQSHQTGADLHELFFTWALLALPFALAAAWGALWAVWFVVLNVGMALLCGWLGPDHVVWQVVDGWGRGRATTWLLPCLVNLLAAGGFNLLRGGRLAAAAPLWLVRLLASVGFVYGTWAAIDATTGSVNSDSLGGVFGISAGVDAGTATLALWALIVSAIAARTWQRRRDVFPMALVAASAIAVSTAWLAHAVRLDGAGSLFLLALWLIAASTGAGLLLMHWVRAWRIAPLAEGAAA